MIKELTKLATHLDSRGLRKEADYLDGIIRKIADKTPIGLGTSRKIQEYLECRIGGIKLKINDESLFATSLKVSIEPDQLGYTPDDSQSTFKTNIDERRAEKLKEFSQEDLNSPCIAHNDVLRVFKTEGMPIFEYKGFMGLLSEDGSALTVAELKDEMGAND